MIRNATPDDSRAICEIYNYYILNSHATFETESLEVPEMEKRISRVVDELALPWLVLTDDQKIMGYAYATQWKGRAAYLHTVETTIYLHQDTFGEGLGSKLYGKLMDQLKKSHFHSILGGIALPNDASVALHEKLGFVKVGLLKDVGYKFGRWIDVGYWQLLVNE